MDFFREVIGNKTITIPVFAWFAAQFLKVVLVIIQERKLDVTRFVGSGGMPSSHSSFVVSMAAVVGKTEGWGSAQFGIAIIIAFIVMYDAAGVRRAAGKQAEVLNKLIFTHEQIQLDKELKELLGHEPLEVFMGALLGAVVGLLLG